MIPISLRLSYCLVSELLIPILLVLFHLFLVETTVLLLLNRQDLPKTNNVAMEEIKYNTKKNVAELNPEKVWKFNAMETIDWIRIEKLTEWLLVPQTDSVKIYDYSIDIKTLLNLWKPWIFNSTNLIDYGLQILTWGDFKYDINVEQHLH